MSRFSKTVATLSLTVALTSCCAPPDDEQRTPTPSPSAQGVPFWPAYSRWLMGMTQPTLGKGIEWKPNPPRMQCEAKPLIAPCSKPAS